MSTIVKNIHIFKDGAWHPIKKVFKDSSWRTMKGIFYGGVWYEIGVTCTVMPDGCAVSTTVHPRWDENATYYGTNNFTLNIYPNGARFDNGSYNSIGIVAGLWHSDINEIGQRGYAGLRYNTGNVSISFGPDNKYAFGVRCVKDYTGSQPTGTILSNDYEDGNNNTYDAVVINNQLWTTTNLYTTKYQDGTSIPNVTDTATWAALTSGAYCWYDNDYSTYGQYYGALYNGYSTDNLVDNNGYRVPSDADWTQLTNYLINTNWCNNIVVTSNNVAQFLKSCSQVNHPLA